MLRSTAMQKNKVKVEAPVAKEEVVAKEEKETPTIKTLYKTAKSKDKTKDKE